MVTGVKDELVWAEGARPTRLLRLSDTGHHARSCVRTLVGTGHPHDRPHLPFSHGAQSPQIGCLHMVTPMNGPPPFGQNAQTPQMGCGSLHMPCAQMARNLWFW